VDRATSSYRPIARSATRCLRHDRRRRKETEAAGARSS
jgi:hypothetical protein